MTARFTRFLLPIMLVCALTACTQAEEVPARNQPPPVPAETAFVAEPAVVEQETVIDLTSVRGLYCGVMQRWDGSEWIQVGGLTDPDSDGESTPYALGPGGLETFACNSAEHPLAPTRFAMTGWNPGWYRICDSGMNCSNTIELR